MEAMIYKAISAIMAEIGAVGKDSKNQTQGFMYRGIDAVMNVINPALVKHKVFVVPTILEQTREERAGRNGGNLIYSICKISFKFYAEDGSYIEAVTVGEGMDSGDKATNKAMAIALKYALFQVFMIPTEEIKNDDPDKECHEASQLTPMMLQTLREKATRKGFSEANIAKSYGVRKFTDMSVKDYKDAMTVLEGKPDKDAEVK